MGKREKAAVCSAPIALVFAAICAQYSKIDIGLASLFYDAEAGTWSLRDHWLARGGDQSLTKLLGGIFGLAQQARSSHFLSHDLVSLGSC